LENWDYFNRGQKTAFDHMVQGFNVTIGLEKGIIVEAFSQGNISDLTEKLVDAANKKVGAEDIPDIFAAYADTAYVVNQLGLVAELDRYLTEEELNEYRSEYLEEGRFDKNGALKIFPTAKSAGVMILNSTDWKPFAQATGVQLSDLETMEGVAEVGRQYYEWTDSLTGTPNDGKAFWGREQWLIISLSAVNNWDWKSFLCAMGK